MLSTFQPLLDAMTGIAYLVDPEGRICAYGETNWNRFSESNGAMELCERSAILGVLLDDFIEGEPKAFYRRCLDDLMRGKFRFLEFPYRCDRADMKRFMRLMMTPVRPTPTDKICCILIQSLTLEEVGRPPLNIYDHKALFARLGEDVGFPTLMMCSFCLDVRFPAGSDAATGTWVSGEKYYQSGGASDVRISHGICPTCYVRNDRGQ